MSDERPFLLVLAGPNGSGKSTLTDYLMAAGIEFGHYINPDQIAMDLDLPEPERTGQAQAIADFQRDRCLVTRKDFSFETVMSHPSKVEFMVRAEEAGYDVTVYFVCTSDPDINVSRVENRKMSGGHDVPPDRIVARYWRSLDLLASAALVAKQTVLFDNSALVGYLANVQLPNPRAGLRPVGEVIRQASSYEITLEADVPAWVFTHLVKPLDDIARASGRGIALTIRQRPGPLS